MKRGPVLSGLLLAGMLSLSACSSTHPPAPKYMATTTAPSGSNTDPDVDFSGVWKNQRNSTMTITRNPTNGSITGDYTTIVGGPGGQPFTRKIVGQSHGDQITFYVDWWPYSMTTWVGQLMSDYSGKETLETVWINTVNIPNADEPADGWKGVRTGGDNFTRQ